MFEAISELPMAARLKERDPPASGPVMYQRWEELLFLHWSVEPELVQAGLPEGLSVDTYEGKAWIGVVPFQMRKVRPRFLPAVPWLSNFPELNLRTYVVDKHGRPGIWFYSLDTPQPIANWIARRFFNLNYRLARFQIDTSRTASLSREGSASELRGTNGLASACADETELVPPNDGCEDAIYYQSSLRLRDGWDEPQNYNWTRVGGAFHAEPGSLEFFLVERYRLFAHNARKHQIWSGQVHHSPYPLQQAEVANYSKRLFALNHLDAPEGEPVSVLASAGVDVTVYPLERV